MRSPATRSAARPDRPARSTRSARSARSVTRLSPVALALLVLALLLGTSGGAVAGALITGKQIKNGTVTGVDIKDGSLTAADLRDEPRTWAAAKTTYTDNFTSPVYTPIVSKALTTARAGYLTITATLYAEDDVDFPSNGWLNYAIQIDGKTVGGFRNLTYSSNGDGENGATTAVVPVSRGAHTVRLVVREFGGGSFIHSAEINAVYSPVGSSSGLVLGRPIAERSANR